MSFNLINKGNAMENQIAGQWKQIKGKVKEAWGKLTDDDLDEINGRREQLIGKVQQRYGKARAEADREVSDFYDRLDR